MWQEGHHEPLGTEGDAKGPRDTGTRTAAGQGSVRLRRAFPQGSWLPRRQLPHRPLGPPQATLAAGSRTGASSSGNVLHAENSRQMPKTWDGGDGKWLAITCNLLARCSGAVDTSG